jgi:hypothetical protein
MAVRAGLEGQDRKATAPAITTSIVIRPERPDDREARPGDQVLPVDPTTRSWPRS